MIEVRFLEDDVVDNRNQRNIGGRSKTESRFIGRGKEDPFDDEALEFEEMEGLKNGQ